MLLAEPWHAREVGLEAIARAELGELAGVGWSLQPCRDELLEELLEAGGRDDLEDPRPLVAGVPKRMPLVAWLEDEVA